MNDKLSQIIALAQAVDADIAALEARIAELEGEQEPPPPPPPPPAEEPILVSPPTITTLVPTVGARVEGTEGEWQNAVSFVHNWLLDDGSVAEANDTGLSSPVRAEYVGKRYIFQVKATGATGAVIEALSVPSSVIVSAEPVPDPAPDPTPDPDPVPDPEPTPDPVPNPTGGIYFIAPTSKGKADGSSKDDAAALSTLNAAIAAVGPGGTIYLLPGDYAAHSAIGISNGGAPSMPVRITSLDHASPAMLIGTRNAGAGSTPWVVPVDADGFRSVRGGTVWGGTGNNLFNLNAGAAWLKFDNFDFKQFARAFSFNADGVHDIICNSLIGFNCQDYFYGRGYGNTTGAYNVTITNGHFVGGSKSCVSPAGNCHDWLIEDVDYDSGYQVSDQFAMGFFVSDVAHNVTFRRVRSVRNLDYEGGDDTNFWNGDGFTFERGTKNLLCEDCYSGFNSDAGYDSKSPGARFIRCTGEGNKENFKLWNDATLQNCQSITPAKTVMPKHGFTGGTGGICDVQVVGGQSVDAPTVVTFDQCQGFDKIQKPAHSNTTSWYGQIIVK